MTEAPVSRTDIEYLSEPDRVSMGDDWFEVASPEHFWIERRFEVLRRIAILDTGQPSRIAEIGCGNGLLQRQVEEDLDTPVDGFDLNEFALKQNISQCSRVCCYDIHHRREELRARYHIVLLCDVLEHIDDEDSFLQSVRFHLHPDGVLVVNVPAFMRLFSRYDEAAGHVRRYDLAMLSRVARRNGLKITKWTYWGLPLVPLLWARRWRVRSADASTIIRKGFEPPGRLANRGLRIYSKLEAIPNHAYGTSLLAVLARS